ncbi:MAG: response regulator [Pseudomonadota bacterium]
MSTLLIAVVDDDPAVRDSLAAFLEGPGREIATYETGDAFLDAIERSPPGLVFLDLKMPGRSGLDVLKHLSPPPMPVIMVTAHGDVPAAVEALKLGAADFMEKPFAPEAVEEAVDGAMRSRAEGNPEALEPLTPREREIAASLAEGRSNKEVARALDISHRTVEAHRARIFEKLGVRNVAGLVRLFADERLL